MSLELSLNGQEYTRSGLNFTRYAPVITSVYPLTGPRSGGFRIELGGTDLTAGSAYRCRFELPPEAAAWAGGLGGWSRRLRRLWRWEAARWEVGRRAPTAAVPLAAVG